MPCISPINLNTAEGRKNVPCGRCHECKARRRKDWQFRLYEELKNSTSSYFITLTYDEENVPYIDHENGVKQVLLKSDLKMFLRTLRDKERYRYKKSGQKMSKYKTIRYYACGEYGDKTGRPHYHLILFNLQHLENVEKSWPHGSIHVGTSNVKTIAYTTKYIMKQYEADKKNPFRPFSLQSKGIGKNYLNKNEVYHRTNEQTSVRNPDGTKQPIPRYYKDKIWPTSKRVPNGEYHKNGTPKYKTVKVKNITRDALREKNLKTFTQKQLREEQRILSLNNKSVGRYKFNQIEAKIESIKQTFNSKTI